MADHKNQHFTPRILMRPFTLDGDGKAINLYAFGTDKVVQNAPVKHQCARNYMYGKDGKIEEGLAKIEGRYSEAISRVLTSADSSEDLDTLRFFAHLQLRRTEMAISRIAAHEQGIFKEVFGNDEPEHPPREYYMVQSLKICFETDNKLSDLKTRIIENRSAVDFVVSDDPAMLTNRYSTQKLGGGGFGLVSSGLILTMPLTPKLALICYDGLVYTVPEILNGRIVLKKDADAEALNELQYINANAGIYFASWDSRDQVREAFKAAEARRTGESAVFTHLICVGTDGNGGEIFRAGTREEALAAKKSMIRTEYRYPVPSRWVSPLKFRRPAKTHYNGTGAGHVRKAEWLR